MVTKGNRMSKDYTKDYEQIVAIDPGANGGLAFWRRDPEGYVSTTCGPMPKTRADLAQLVDDLVYGDFASTLFVVEDVPRFVSGMATPPSSMAKLHQNFGFLLGVISAHVYGRQLERSLKLVLKRPADWQKAVSAGNKKDWAKGWKAHLKELACGIYPSLANRRLVTYKTADALLMLAPFIGQV